jgi:hypothetical protein
MKRNIDMAMRPYMKRYTVRTLGFGAAYTGALIGGVMLMKSAAAPVGLGAYLVALTPALFVVAMIWAMFKLLEETDDEYQRLLLAKGILLGTGITLSMTTAWGFLEAFGLVRHIELYWVVVLWFPMTGLGGRIVRRHA